MIAPEGSRKEAGQEKFVYRSSGEAYGRQSLKNTSSPLGPPDQIGSRLWVGLSYSGVLCVCERVGHVCGDLSCDWSRAGHVV